MEEFRAVVVDGYVLSLVNRNQVHPDDFQQTKNGVHFAKEALVRYLAGYHGRMQQSFQHPRLNEQTTYLCAIELQVRQLARVISGEAPVYELFLVLGRKALTRPWIRGIIPVTKARGRNGNKHL